MRYAAPSPSESKNHVIAIQPGREVVKVPPSRELKKLEAEK